MVTLRKSGILAICIALLTSFSASSYQVQPMVSELQTVGNRSSITYRVINPADTSIPIEVEVMTRTFDENQKEILTPNEDDFIVLPPQIDVPANGYQVFRAQYIGEGELDSTKSYRIVFKQLPLKTEQQQSQVNMVFNFATLVFMSPPTAKGALTQTLNCEDKASCVLKVVNSGNGVMNLLQSTMHINGSEVGDWTWLQAAIGMTYLMPNHVLNIDVSELVKDMTAVTSVEMVTADNAI